MRQIRVAHVSTVDQSLTALLKNQIRTLGESGFTVTGISSPGPFVAELTETGVPHIAVPISRNVAPLSDLRSLAALYRVFRRERFDVVHTHTPKAGLLGQLAARAARVPVIVNTIHGFYLHDRMSPLGRRGYLLLERLAAGCSDVILTQNREDIEIALREGVCGPDKLHFIGNGIDLSQFDPGRFSRSELAVAREELGIPADAPVVGFVGRLAARRKGFLDFLEAARIIRETQPACRFLIVGAADLGKPDAVEPDVARDYGVADACIFLGQRPNSELPRLYRLMDVLALPSLFEGLPRCVMEAAAMGVPAVVTEVKGNREAVDDGVNGYRVPYGAPPALAAALLRVLSDPALAAGLGAQARVIAAERFDETLVFRRVIGEYERLLASAASSRATRALPAAIEGDGR